MTLPGDLRLRLSAERCVVLNLKITPKAPRTAWAGVLDDGAIKVRIAAPAEKGKANAELVRFLARELGIGTGQVEIVTGATSPKKRVRLTAAPESPAA